MFDEICQKFRSDWLQERAMADADGVQALEIADTHQSSCAECKSWIRSTKTQIQLLLELPELEAPEQLDELVERAIVSPPPEERVEEILAALPRRSAPDELEHRITQNLRRDIERRPGIEEDAEREVDRDRSVQTVRVLDIEPVPNVLERLVGEELGAPAAHRVERMVGNLSHRGAPRALARRVADQLRPHSVRKLVLAPLATLLAACLLLWVLFHQGGEETPRYSFQVVHAQDARTLNPVARQFAEALSAGAANAVREVAQEKGG